MDQEIPRLKRRIEREIQSRKSAEKILEQKALELYNTNEKLKRLNEELEEKVLHRSKALIESEERYRRVVESASDVIFNTDHQGFFTYINATGAELYGYKEEDVVGSHFLKYIHSDFKEVCYDHFSKLFDDNLPESYFEFKVARKNGEVIWVGQNTKRLELNDKVTFTAVARDITEQKIAEEKLLKARELLLKSEQKYRSIIENMSLGILEVDLKGRIVRAHDEFCKMVDYREEDLVGKQSDSLLISEEYRQKLIKSRDEYVASVHQVQIKKRDGSMLWVIISGAPYYDEYGEIAGSVGIYFDITPQKNLEQELKNARQIAESAQMAEKHFLASMSHEIRTPLNAIIGMTHLLKDTNLNREQGDYLDILDSSSSLLLSLISDILDISKIDAGAIEIQKGPVDIHDLTSTIRRTFSIKLGEKGIDMSVYVDPQLNTLLLTDRLLLNQILMNLVGNAAKFTESGLVRLNVSQVGQEAGLKHVLFEIVDTGIGIEKDKQNIIFDQFRQADSKITDSYGGTGLGLSITKKLIELLGGQINLNSTFGEGSTFYFTIPIEDTGTSIKPEKNTKAAKIQKLNVGKKSLLVVEDNPMNQKYIGTLLSKYKIPYEIANDGLEALNKSQSKKYDLIFMDLQMPVMNGIEATMSILKDSLNMDTPIVALTASTFLSKKQEALEAGMTDFLSKPFTPNQLTHIIQKYINMDSDNANHGNNDVFQFSRDLDYEFLEQVYEDDLDYAYDIFEAFLETYQEEYKLLQVAVKESKYAEVKRVAHKMKPTFAMVGLPELSEYLQKLERLGVEEDGDGINQYYGELTSMLDEKVSIVKAEMARIEKYK